ncbi:MAG: phenylalanine--tRNA ligase subunit alpha [Candidatus Falkowbacteria bacterium]
MEEKLLKIKNAALKELESIKNIDEFKKTFTKYLGRKQGILTDIVKDIKNLGVDAKKAIGQVANQVKNDIAAAFAAREKELEGAEIEKNLSENWVDVTLPGLPASGQGKKNRDGHLHPNTQIQYELEDIFRSLGFLVLDGPELESDYYNFEGLNIPPYHPARDSQDTFYIKDHSNWLMRTHTSPVQVRALQKYGAPIRAIVPGRAFRNEATDASHEHTFYQLEGLVCDKNISIANLIAVMNLLLKGILKRDIKTRLRPGYFPFVEPGFELDINCLLCGGKGCKVCKYSGWIEILPCGMVHPNVLKHGGVDPEKYSGFAFGLGMDRLVMMKYGIDDIRLLQSGDLRFLQQF